MKKLFFILALILFAQSAQAQLFSKERLSNLETFDNRFLSWGYFLGFNSYDFKFEYVEKHIISSNTALIKYSLIQDPNKQLLSKLILN